MGTVDCTKDCGEINDVILLFVVNEALLWEAEYAQHVVVPVNEIFTRFVREFGRREFCDPF